MKKNPYHHKDLKNTLIEKGIEMVSSNGINEFSLRKVSVACGVSHTAPYSHFKDKNDLLDNMKQYITNQFVEILENTINQYQKEPELLLHMGKAYIMFFINNPYYFSFLYSQSNIKIDLSSDSCDEDNFKPFVIFRKVVFYILENYKYSKEEKNDFVIALWSIVHGISSIATMKNVVYSKNWEQKIIDFLKVFDKDREDYI